jgi:predicted nucleic acid-binding Zn finger protein
MTESVRGQEQESRVVRAFAESADYTFVMLAPGRYAVATKSGKSYQLTPSACSCPDHQHRCAGTEMRCKHVVALRHKLLVEETH